MYTDYPNCKRYFAAANSYSGFVSFFSEVIQPERLTKTIILKGGPGTGKSSFMKSAAKRFLDNDFTLELILCSSDSDSLDGIIARRGNKSFAILDGTAPHTVDPIYPGSHELLFTLSDFWNEKILTKSRSEIESLVKNKKSFYKSGYRNLSLCKGIDTYIEAEYKSAFQEKKADQYTSALLADIKKPTEQQIHLLRAFGKKGYESIAESEIAPQSSLLLTGDRRAVRLLIEYTIGKIGVRNIDCFYPSTEVPTSYDGILIGDHYIGAAIGKGGIPIETFFTLSLLDSDAEKAIQSFERQAQSDFSSAFECHCELENIYGNAMNFSLLDEAREELLKKIMDMANSGE